MCTFILHSFCSLGRQYCYDVQPVFLHLPASNSFVFLYFWLLFFQALHYDCHSSGRLLLWSSWHFFRAWNSYCSVEVAMQISSSEALNKPHNSPYACLGLIIFALHGSIKKRINSMYFMWTRIMCPVRSLLCLFHINILKTQVVEILAFSTISLITSYT